MLGKPRSLETILDHIRRAHMSMGGGDIRAPKTDKRRKPCGDLEEKVSFRSAISVFASQQLTRPPQLMLTTT